MMKIFIQLLTPILLLTGTQGYGQQLDSMMTVYADNFPKEKIHIHFDKRIYNKEETIFYKVYVLADNQLSNLSTNIYLEWYNTEGKMIKQTVSPLQQSTAKGSFDLPANYEGDFIHVKAYTRWMLNDDTAFRYQRNISLNNGIQTKTSKPITYQTLLATFPEGGWLVEGIQSKVAFKATNQFGLPMKLKGLLMNTKNKVLDTMKIQHDGMGAFLITPLPNENYQVKYVDEFGNSGIQPLPPAKKIGATLQIETSNEKAIVHVNRSAQVPETDRKLTLLVHMNQHLLYTIKLNLTEKTQLKAEVPIDELPTGIVQFTLFNASWMPLAERIIFVNNHQHEFSAKINEQLINLGKRAKNVIDIQVTDTSFSNMSLSITDAAIGGPDENSIYSSILLSSELKGRIINPAYYLNSDADSVTKHLDLVMLTNGWRRFDWEKIKQAIPPNLTFPIEKDYMKIKGTVYGYKQISSSKPIILNLVYMGKDSVKQFAFLPVNKEGKFESEGLSLRDSLKIYYGFNANEKLATQTQIGFENGLIKYQPKTIKYPEHFYRLGKEDSLSKLQLAYFLNEQELLKKRMASATLEEVIVKSRGKSNEEKLDEKYTTGLFSGGDGQTFDLSTDMAAKSTLDIFSFLQGKVAGLTINRNGPVPSLSWRGASPSIYVNEMISTPDMVQSTNINDIAMVKVFRPPFFGAAGGGAGGAIAIYLKKGADMRGNQAGKGMEYAILAGYSQFKEFYQPKYDKPTGNFDTDNRTTLYWNPYVLTNQKNGRYRIEFYNNDVTKKFQMVLEGVNSSGKMTRVVKWFN